MEQCETEGCSGLVFKQHLCLVCANKLFDDTPSATSSDEQRHKAALVKAIEKELEGCIFSDNGDCSIPIRHHGANPSHLKLLQDCLAALQGSDSKCD
jgi:hypothetical protein